MKLRAHMDKDGKLNWGVVEMIVLALTIVAFLYSGLGGYAVMANDVDQNTQDIHVNTAKVEKVDAEIDDVKLKIAGMEPVLNDVKQTVGRVEDKLDAVLIGLSQKQ